MDFRRFILLFILANSFFQIQALELPKADKPVVMINRLMFPTLSYSNNYDVLGDFESLVIPLKRAGKLILLDAIADSVSGSLILDTGASGLVLNSIYFRDGKPKSGYVAGGVTGKLEQLQHKKIGQMRFDEVYYENISADLTDLGHLETSRQVKVLGFFGLSLFQDFEVVLNLQQNLLELHRLDKKGNRLNTAQQIVPDLELPIFNYNDVYFVEGKISNKRYTFCLDTGAEANVLHNYLPDKIMNTITILRRSTLRGSGRQSAEVFYGLMNDFSIGDFALPGMQTLIANLNAMSEAYGMPVDGMLGCAFFEKGVFSFNLTKKQLGIHFFKNEKP